MDSGNSGSIPSSSGGSEEYDSRADSISTFFNHPFGFATQPLPPAAAAMFDPLSNYLDHPLSRSTNQVPNWDALWSKNLRYDPNYTNPERFMATATSSPPPTQQLLNNQQQAQSKISFPQVAEIEQHNNSNRSNNNMGRNPKKRSRASRRAPTTVLTTDTSNFRAMVQEFTGIPAPPFARPRLDLFGSPSSSHYFLRPFPQKIPSPITNITTSCSTSVNHQLPSDQFGFLKPPQNDFLNTNMQNPILNLQFPNSTKPQGSQLKMGVFVSNHGHAGTNVQEIASSDGGALLRNENGTKHWGQHDQSVVRSINGGYGDDSWSRRVSDERVSNLLASSSDLIRGGEGPGNVAPRSEGMMESWICSSD